MPMLEKDRSATTGAVVEMAKTIVEAENNAVKDVPAEIEALGASSEQANAVASAVRLYHLREPDYENRARRILIEGGFVNGSVDLMLEKIAADSR